MNHTNHTAIKKELPLDRKPLYTKPPHNASPSSQAKEPPYKPYVKDTPPVTFDEKPVMSLKDALAKALNEHTTSPKEIIEKHEEVRENKVPQEMIRPKYEEKEVMEEKKRKEIAEDVLRKLLEEE